jgi:nicotinamide-nucleotide amidase
VSGIAGPGGGTLEKPVGTVCLAWAGSGMDTQTRCLLFTGNREAVRRLAVAAVLRGLLDLWREQP